MAESTAPEAACSEMGALAEAHKNFEALVGTFKAEVKMWMDPTADPSVSQGTMINTMVVGGHFLQQDYKDDTGMFEGKGFWGYNSTDNCFEGFWIDTMANFFQIEKGQHDASADTYNMNGSMTCPTSGQAYQKRSVIKYVDANTNSIEMYFTGPDGNEAKMMEINYKRA